MSWVRNIILIYLTLINFIKFGCSSKILAIFPTPSISHQVVFRPVMEELALRGHEITLLTPNPYKNAHKNIEIIDLNFLYEDWKKIDFAETADLNPFEILELLLTIMRQMMVQILEMKEVHPILTKEKHYDLVIAEFLGYTPMYAFSELYNVPLVGMTSLDMSPSEHASMGNEVHPILHPHLVFPFYGTDLTFKERVAATYMTWIMNYYFTPRFGGKLDKIIHKYFNKNQLNSYDLTRSACLVINNAHPALGFTRPIVPTTIQVGLLHVQEPKPLPGDLENYMKNSKNGVIYFSLGSNVKSVNLKNEHFQIFLSVFKRLKYDVIWKFENETMEGKPSNVVIRKWLPQQDLLAHQNLKLFITHGGQQSMEEAVDRGIPLLCIPFFGDQERNSKKIEHLGIGRRLNLNELSEKNFETLINEVIDNKTYKNTIIELRDAVKDTPLSPVHTAAWWIEYVLRHNGTQHIRYSGLGFPHYKYYLLDVFAFTIVLLLILVVMLYYRFSLCLKFFRKNRSNDSKNKIKSN